MTMTMARASAPAYSLTRFLYIKDEVELSLVTALLKKKNLQECYYWASELYYSGFDLFQLLWKIYFDFYYEFNPVMEMYMLKKQAQAQAPAAEAQAQAEAHGPPYIASIIRNLFRLKSSPNTFILRHYIKTDILPNVIYSHVKSVWISSYPVKFHKLLLAIHNGHVENTCYFIKLLVESGEMVDTLWQLIMTFVKPNLIDLGLEMEIVSFEKKWAMRMYNNDLHYLLAFICHLQIPIRNLNKCNIFVTPKEEDMEFIYKVEYEPVPLLRNRGMDIEQIYNTLCFKRYFKISEKIGSFKLTRWSLSVGGNYDDFLRKNWFHWEYYAANGCPLWRARLEKCHGVLDHVNENIVFPKDNVNVNVNVNVNNNEPDKEQFYDLYAYEFDELPKDIQRMSHCDIKRAKWQDWYFDVFPSEEPKTIIVGLNNEFEFMWY